MNVSSNMADIASNFIGAAKRETKTSLEIDSES